MQVSCILAQTKILHLFSRSFRKKMRTETAEMSNNKELSGFPCWVCASRGEEMRFLDITARARHMDLLHALEYVGEPGADELFDSGYLSSLRNHPANFQDDGKHFVLHI